MKVVLLKKFKTIGIILILTGTTATVNDKVCQYGELPAEIGHGQNERPDKQKISPPQAYSRLMKIGFFALGGIGAAGIMSDGELYLRIILNDRSARRYLKLLATDGSAAAKLYALCGLKKKDRKLFRHFVGLLGKKTGWVTEVSGCSQAEEDFAELVRRIDGGLYDGFLIEEWVPGKAGQDAPW